MVGFFERTWGFWWLFAAAVITRWALFSAHDERLEFPSSSQVRDENSFVLTTQQQTAAEDEQSDSQSRGPTE